MVDMSWMACSSVGAHASPLSRYDSDLPMAINGGRAIYVHLMNTSGAKRSPKHSNVLFLFWDACPYIMKTEWLATFRLSVPLCFWLSILFTRSLLVLLESLLALYAKCTSSVYIARA